MNKNLATIPDAGKLDTPRDLWELPDDQTDNGSGAPIQHGIPLPELKFDGQSGEFTDADGDSYSAKDGVAIIPLVALGATRIFWRKGVRLPLCGSDDNREPWADIDIDTIGAGPMCGNCMYGQWEGGKAPECKEVQNYAVMLADDADATIHVLKVAGNSIKPLRTLWSQLPPKRWSFSNVVRLTAERRDVDGNRYYVINAALTGGYPAAELFATYQERWQKAQEFVIPDRKQLARKLREEDRRSRGPRVQTQADLPYEEIPQIGEPGTQIFDGDGQRRVYGADGRIEPVISEMQREYLTDLMDAIEFDRDRVGALILELYGEAGAADLDDLSSSEASGLIERLKVLKTELKKVTTKTAKA